MAAMENTSTIAEAIHDALSKISIDKVIITKIQKSNINDRFHEIKKLLPPLGELL